MTNSRGRSTEVFHCRRPDPRARLEEQEKLKLLAELASYRLDELLAELGVTARRAGKMLAGPCPVHGGDKHNAFNLYPDGHTTRGVWFCRTHRCEKTFRNSLVGLVRGVLSHQRYGWSGGGRAVPFPDAVRWLCRFVGREWGDLRPDLALAEKTRFVSEQATLGRLPETPSDGWPRAAVRARLAVPSPYYLGRGYTPAVLDRYDVGDATTADPASPMYRRAAVPVFDPAGARVVGVTGRTLWPKCDDCKCHHDPAAVCPPPARRHLPEYAKWRHTDGFARERVLYNWWAAAAPARRAGQVLLVEGPGEVWRAVEAGCEVAAGLFGVTLTDPQQVVLEASGVLEVVVALNDDEPGRAGAAAVAAQLRRAFRVRAVTPPGADLGAAPAAAVRDWCRANKIHLSS